MPWWTKRVSRSGRSIIISKAKTILSPLTWRGDKIVFALFRRWFSETEGSTADKVQSIFHHLAASARHPKWKGCGFLRTSAELANMPGHPAIKIGAAHKKRFESWVRETFESEGIRSPSSLARQVVLLMDGAFAAGLLHRDASYMEAAGEAAFALVTAALPTKRQRR